MADDEHEALARRFHEAYERLAPDYGYKTRDASAVDWEFVPDANRSLMIAVAGEILAGFRRQGPITDAQVDRVAEAIARVADADYWTTEISEWEGSEDWEREAHPDNYPDGAYEDREWYRKQARAALEAARDAS